VEIRVFHSKVFKSSLNFVGKENSYKFRNCNEVIKQSIISQYEIIIGFIDVAQSLV